MLPKSLLSLLDPPKSLLSLLDPPKSLLSLLDPPKSLLSLLLPPPKSWLCLLTVSLSRSFQKLLALVRSPNSSLSSLIARGTVSLLGLPPLFSKLTQLPSSIRLFLLSWEFPLLLIRLPPSPPENLFLSKVVATDPVLLLSRVPLKGLESPSKLVLAPVAPLSKVPGFEDPPFRLLRSPGVPRSPKAVLAMKELLLPKPPPPLSNVPAWDPLLSKVLRNDPAPPKELFPLSRVPPTEPPPPRETLGLSKVLLTELPAPLSRLEVPPAPLSSVPPVDPPPSLPLPAFPTLAMAPSRRPGVEREPITGH